MRFRCIALALLVGILAACNSNKKYPTESEVKTLLISRVGSGTLINDSSVDDLKCKDVGLKVTCGYLVAAVPHQDSFMRDQKGQWQYTAP